ncbi:hypothetical protein ACQ4PT_041335 [Festuca glaucescens]
MVDAEGLSLSASSAVAIAFPRGAGGDAGRLRRSVLQLCGARARGWHVHREEAPPQLQERGSRRPSVHGGRCCGPWCPVSSATRDAGVASVTGSTCSASLGWGPLLPQPGAPPAPSRDRPAVAAAPSTVPYRVPACQRLGTVDAVAAPAPFPRPPIKERLGVRDVDQVEAVSEETPFERGVRREREIRAASPLRREEVEMGVSLYARGLRNEHELHAAALASVDARPVVTPSRSEAEVAMEIDAARPASERCIIYRTPKVDEAERALRWGLVAFVSGTRRSVSCSAASAVIIECFPSLASHFSIHRFWLSDFLFIFNTRANWDILLADNLLDGRDISLRFGVWNRQLQATRRTFRFRVHLEVVGVPPVAWSMSTAKTILGSSAWVERLGTETTSKADMGSFRIMA